MTSRYDQIRYAHVSKEELPAPIADPKCPMCKGYGHPGYMMNASQWVGCHLAIKGRCPDVRVGLSEEQETLNRLEERGRERKKLLEDLAHRLNVEELFGTLGIELPEGGPVSFGPVGKDRHVVAIVYGGKEYRLPEPVSDDEWSLRFGVLKYRSSGG